MLLLDGKIHSANKLTRVRGRKLKNFLLKTFLLELKNDFIYFSSNERTTKNAHTTFNDNDPFKRQKIVIFLFPLLNDFDDNFLSCWLELLREMNLRVN